MRKRLSLGRFTLQLCVNYRSNYRVVLLQKRPRRANYPQLRKELPSSGPPQNHLSPLSIIMSIITIYGAKDRTG
jgi:NADPH-dependent 7-cyano-7-deazaguanine reductase QueF-like protein